MPRTPRRRPQAEAEAQDAAADLARLAVADAARREWAEAHAGLAARAEAAERELRARGLAERIPVTDAEVAEASAEPRHSRRSTQPTRPGGRPSRRPSSTLTARPSAELWGREIPVTEAELEAAQAADRAEAEAEPEVIRPQSSADWWLQYHERHPELGGQDRPGAETHEADRAEREASPERPAGEADLAEVRAELERLGELVDRIPDQAAERRAEMDAGGH